MTSAGAPEAAARTDDARSGAGSSSGARAPAPRGPVRRRQPPRDVVRRYPCPVCGATAGELCRGRRGDRKSNHLARVELAVELRYGQRLVLPRISRSDDRDGAPVKPRSGDPGGVDRRAVEVSLPEILGSFPR